MNITKKLQLKKKFVLAIKSYRISTLNILHIFAYGMHSVHFYIFKNLHECT